MKICVVNDVRSELNVRLPECDLAVFGFGALGNVDYESELAGKSDKFERVALLSGAAGCGVLCGCITDSHGFKRKSVAAACSGRLLGIADMMHVLDEEEIKCGAHVAVYAMKGFKVGLVIGNDLYFPDCVKTLAMCGCNLVCVHADGIEDGVPPLLIRAYAYLYGMPFVLCGGGAACLADISGVAACSNREIAIFETSPKNCYRSVTSRRRGILSENFCDY